MFHRWHFRASQKGGLLVGKTKRGKGTKIMAIAERTGLPAALCTASASPAEVTLTQLTVESRITDAMPQRLIGDKAYDSDGLDRHLEAVYGIEMIAPNCKGRRPDRKAQDGRALRRYRRRWKVERFFAWLFNFPRLVVRYEYHAHNYHGLVQLACTIILLRHL